MRRSKKVIIGVVLAGVLLVGSLGGIALADDSDNGPAAKVGDFINNVIANYERETGDDIDDDALKAAFADARTEMRASAMEKRLQGLTDEQKEALQEWWDSRPEDLPMKFGGRMHGGFRGMGGPCAPTTTE